VNARLIGKAAPSLFGMAPVINQCHQLVLADLAEFVAWIWVLKPILKLTRGGTFRGYVLVCDDKFEPGEMKSWEQDHRSRLFVMVLHRLRRGWNSAEDDRRTCAYE
jgi:hypothetical protein